MKLSVVSTMLSIDLYLASNCHSVRTQPFSSSSCTLADNIVASSGTCHCYPEYHNFYVYVTNNRNIFKFLVNNLPFLFFLKVQNTYLLFLLVLFPWLKGSGFVTYNKRNILSFLVSNFPFLFLKIQSTTCTTSLQLSCVVFPYRSKKIDLLLNTYIHPNMLYKYNLQGGGGQYYLYTKPHCM